MIDPLTRNQLDQELRAAENDLIDFKKSKSNAALAKRFGVSYNYVVKRRRELDCFHYVTTWRRK